MLEIRIFGAPLLALALCGCAAMWPKQGSQPAIDTSQPKAEVVAKCLQAARRFNRSFLAEPKSVVAALSEEMELSCAPLSEDNWNP